MSRPSPAKSLPRGIRFAALLAALVAGLVWMRSFTETFTLLVARPELAAPLPTAELERPVYEAQQAFVTEWDRALGPMREVRVLTLAGLTLTCGLVFFSALGLVRPAGLPRAGFRRRLSHMAIAAALLRAADGAQQLALMRALAGPTRQLMKAQLELRLSMLPTPPAMSLDELATWASRLALGWEVLLTAVMAGTLLALGQYFGSARVREAVSLRDGFLES